MIDIWVYYYNFGVELCSVKYNFVVLLIILIVCFFFEVFFSCDVFLLFGYIFSGIYCIDFLDGNGGFGVNCDNENGGGGWLIILRWYDGFLDFDCGWFVYVEGLGDLIGEFWLGLEKMYRFIGGLYFNLRFDFEFLKGIKKYVEYEGCLLDKDWKYKIIVGSYLGEKWCKGWNLWWLLKCEKYEIFKLRLSF